MTQPPLEHPEGPLDLPGGAEVPGADDHPVTAPRDVLVPRNDGDLDVGDPPDGVGSGDDEAERSGRIA